jgi:hypothetical protein
MKAHLLLLVPVTTLGVASAARAADDSPQPIQAATPTQPALPVAPRINLDTPAVGRPVQRTYHLHEGFYLRASLGFGDYRASFSDGNHANQDFSEQGGSMSLDLLIGGSPSPGVSIGGALLLEPLFGADYQRGGAGVGSHGGFSTLLGPFIDGFPDATKGWHLGGMVGLAAQSFQDVNGTNGGKTTSAGGVGGAAWFGYDFWVGSQWALGPQLRLMGMRTSDTKAGEDISAWARSFTLGISAVFN